MDKNIQDFISGKEFAVVGVSHTCKKFGYAVYTELKQRGYKVYAVNPAATEINGEPCYPNLAALPGKVDGVVVCVPPAKGEAVLRDAAKSGLRNVWVQQGAQSPQLAALGKELGLNLVSGKCILMYAQPVQSFHSVHRFVAKVFGQL